MKWLSLFKKKRKDWNDDGGNGGGCEWSGPHSPKAGHSAKRRSMQERKERTSIEQWHEARKSRTSIDVCCSGGAVTTTERLSVCKAGMTTLINRTYIVIKHLGSGTSGQVKLAFNLRSKKLVAIKAVLKSASGGASAFTSSGSSAAMHAMSCDGGSGPLPHCAGSSLLGRPSPLARGWRSLTSTGLRRSNSSTATSGTLPSWAAQPGLDNSAAAAVDARRLAKAEEFVREIAILKRLSHPNVVQLLEVIDDPASDNLLIVMGYVEGRTLQPEQLEPNRWKPVAEDTVWRQARDVMLGLDYLHSHGVVHGDLKPANLIQDSLTGVIKILDFGSAVLHSRPDGLRGAHGPTGCTPAFRSPESLESGYRPSFELDMWALGVCLYLWVVGELPFKGSAPFVVYEAIRNHPLQLPAHARISKQLADLLSKLLDKNPQTRLTVRQAMQHPWTSAQNLAPLRPLRPVFAAVAREQSVSMSAPAAAAAKAVAAPSPLPPPPVNEGPSSDMAVDEPVPWCQSSTQPLVPGTAMVSWGAAAAMSTSVAAAGGGRSCIRWTEDAQQRRARRTRSMIDSDLSADDDEDDDDADEDDDDEDDDEGDDQLGRGAANTESDYQVRNMADDDCRWELRRSVTDEELEAAISSCFSPTGSAAVLMEGIFTEVTFAKGHQIIRAGDNLDQIYLIVAGEVELYHDLLADGPDSQLPDRPLIQGLEDEDPEATLADPGDFLNIRLPGIRETTLDRLPTSMLTASGPGAAGPGPAGTGAADGPRQLQPQLQHLSSLFAPGGSAGGSLGSVGAAGVAAAGAAGGGNMGFAWHGSAGSRGGTSSQYLSSAAQAGMIVVATKGPGDSLGFAGLGSSSGSSGAGGAAKPAQHRPVWLANVRAKTQVTTFAASIASLHKLARTHPQVEPLLRQIAWQQETDMAVAEAMRCLRLAAGNNNHARSRSSSVAVTGAGTSTTNTTFTTGTTTTATPATTATGGGGCVTAVEQEDLAECTAATASAAAVAAWGAFGLAGHSSNSVAAATVVVPWRVE